MKTYNIMFEQREMTSREGAEIAKGKRLGEGDGTTGSALHLELGQAGRERDSSDRHTTKSVGNRHALNGIATVRP